MVISVVNMYKVATPHAGKDAVVVLLVNYFYYTSSIGSTGILDGTTEPLCRFYHGRKVFNGFTVSSSR